MPVKVAKRGKVYRVIEAKTGRLAKNKGGTPVSKGFKTKAKATAQVRAINRSLKLRGKI